MFRPSPADFISVGASSRPNFLQVIDRAKEACVNSGQTAEDHFADTSRMIGIGKGGRREVDDYQIEKERKKLQKDES